MPLILLVMTAALAAQEEMADRAPLHIWVREDLFAGFLANDMERFQKGVAKLEKILAANPSQPEALAWMGGADMYLAVRAREGGNQAEYARLWTKAAGRQEKALELAPASVGVLATYGGTLAVFADRLDDTHKAEAWKKARSLYAALYEAQASMLDKMPLHHRGEVLAGVAMSAQRTGDVETAGKFLARIVRDLPGSPYEGRAKKWIEQPELASRSSIACQTCHDANRLDNFLKRTAKQ